MAFRPARPVLLAALAATCLAGFSAAAAVSRAPAALADEVDDSIAQLKEIAKSGDEGKAIAKITELEAKLDGRVTDALADVARTSKSDKIAKAAMKVAAQRKDDGLFKWMKGRLDDKKMAEDRPEVYLSILDSLSFYSDKSMLKPLEDVIKKNIPNNANYSKAAIRAFGGVREKPVVEQLIKWLAETENTKVGGQSSAKSMSAQTREKVDAAHGAVLKALQALTGEDLGEAAAWEKWWKESQKTFQFPDPNQAEVDPATLDEYPDRAYGFTIKKPKEGKYWTFAKCEQDGGRVALLYRDDQGVLWARMNAVAWKGSNDITSPESFAAWYVKQFQDKEFDQFSKGPDIEKKTIGGREFHVVTARGVGKEAWKNWAACERRIYITRATPTTFVYFECAVLSGTEEPLKAAFWGAIEGMAWKPQK